MSNAHRAGPLRQENKRHKGRQGKRATKAAHGGRVDSSKIDKQHSKKRAQTGRLKRANQAKQTRRRKRDEIILQKRLGSDDGPPKICMWLSLSAEAYVQPIQDSLLGLCDNVTNTSTSMGMITGASKQHKYRMTLLTPPRDIKSVLECAKVADVIVAILPLGQGTDSAVDEEGEMAMTALKGMGISSLLGVLQGLEGLPSGKQSVLRKWGQRFFETEFTSQTKVVDATNTNMLLRSLSFVPVKQINWRSTRSYVLAEEAEVTVAHGSAVEGTGTLRLRGYIRGRPLNVNDVVHIGGVGHLHLRQVIKQAEPCTIKGKDKLWSGDKIESKANPNEATVVAVADSNEQEDLREEAEVNALAGEQTWPTEEELAGTIHDQGGGDVYTADGTKRRAASSQGMSNYQAVWLGDDDVPVTDESNDGMQTSDEEEGCDEIEDNLDKLGSSVSEELPQHRKAEIDDAQFPDEVNTPANHPARMRFARFRALKSFRTTPWDPKENLPEDYSRIFQFENFLSMQKNVLASGQAIERQQNKQLMMAMAGNRSRESRLSSFSSDAAMAVDTNDGEQDDANHGWNAQAALDQNYVQSGTYVDIFIDGVPIDLLEKRKAALDGHDYPLQLFSLLQHEHRLSVLHFNLYRDGRYDEPVPSKSPLTFQCGFRTWKARPIFSQVNLNCDKHKYERFLRPECFTAASTYGPTTYQPAPVLVFKEVVRANGSGSDLKLVAMGTLLGVDPDRIVLKKVVLTGYPIRVRKRKAVVKHMFHFPEDVKWFKPTELTTKYGLTGHIKEPVGTHGLMKVIFNKAVKQNDTVCLNLYKRVYPKMVDGHVQVV